MANQNTKVEWRPSLIFTMLVRDRPKILKKLTRPPRNLQTCMLSPQNWSNLLLTKSNHNRRSLITRRIWWCSNSFSMCSPHRNNKWRSRASIYQPCIVCPHTISQPSELLKTSVKPQAIDSTVRCTQHFMLHQTQKMHVPKVSRCQWVQLQARCAPLVT